MLYFLCNYLCLLLIIFSYLQMLPAFFCWNWLWFQIKNTLVDNKKHFVISEHEFWFLRAENRKLKQKWLRIKSGYNNS